VPPEVLGSVMTDSGVIIGLAPGGQHGAGWAGAGRARGEPCAWRLRRPGRAEAALMDHLGMQTR